MFAVGAAEVDLGFGTKSHFFYLCGESSATKRTLRILIKPVQASSNVYSI